MNHKLLSAKALALGISIVGLSATTTFADCFRPFHAVAPDNWDLTVSADYKSSNIESADLYLSGPNGTDDWRAVHDIDGDLYGFTMKLTPTTTDKRVSMA